MKHDNRIGASQKLHPFEQLPSTVFAVDKERALWFYWMLISRHTYHDSLHSPTVQAISRMSHWRLTSKAGMRYDVILHANFFERVPETPHPKFNDALPSICML